LPIPAILLNISTNSGAMKEKQEKVGLGCGTSDDKVFAWWSLSVKITQSLSFLTFVRNREMEGKGKGGRDFNLFPSCLILLVRIFRESPIVKRKDHP